MHNTEKQGSIIILLYKMRHSGVTSMEKDWDKKIEPRVIETLLNIFCTLIKCIKLVVELVKLTGKAVRIRPIAFIQDITSDLSILLALKVHNININAKFFIHIPLFQKYITQKQQ